MTYIFQGLTGSLAVAGFDLLIFINGVTLFTRTFALREGMMEGSGSVHICTLQSFEEPIRIALTGGQIAGKTAVSERIALDMRDRVLCVPEAATFFRERVTPRPPLNNREAMRTFQAELFQFQLDYEDEARMRARRLGRRIVLFIRGTLDGAAYLEGGLEEFERLNGTAVGEQLGRYDVVIFLCQASQEVFEKERPASSGWACARARHELLKRVWSLHPHVFHIETWEMEEKVQRSSAIIERILCLLDAQRSA